MTTFLVHKVAVTILLTQEKLIPLHAWQDEQKGIAYIHYAGCKPEKSQKENSR